MVLDERDLDLATTGQDLLRLVWTLAMEVNDKQQKWKCMIYRVKQLISTLVW